MMTNGTFLRLFGEELYMERYLSRFEQFIIKSMPKLKWYTIIFIVVSLPSIYVIVYFTGGIKYVFSHSMYLPILIAGIILGKKGGVVTAVLGGILLGPLMPIDSITLEPQLPINYLYRLGIFILIGFLSGFASDLVKKQIKSIVKMYAINQETGIPNTNAILDHSQILQPNKELLIITILINNSDTIIDVMGLSTYNVLIYEIYQNLLMIFNNQKLIVQAGNAKLWIVKYMDNIEVDIHQVLDALSKQIVINNVPFYLEYSLGAAYLENTDKLIRLDIFSKSDSSAREAMKQNLPYIFYDQKFYQKKQDLELLGSFTESLSNEELYLVYQPIIDLKTNKVQAIEALARWNHPKKGIIFPDRFIPLIEETKLIHQLTKFVINKAVMKLQELEKKFSDIQITINVSSKDLYDCSFAATFIDLIQSSNIKKDKLVMEITETAFLEYSDKITDVLHKLSDAGIVISLDDYGTGYSSLAYLGSFPIHILKIDRLFVSKIEENEAVFQIVKSTIDLAHQLGYRVIAEGVEQVNCETLLKELNCDMSQGYYYAKPMSESEIMSWLENTSH